MHFTCQICSKQDDVSRFFQDQFKYTYPPLPDDDFQTPLCENGPMASDDDAESKEGEMESRDTLESSFNSEIVAKPKKVNCFVNTSSKSFYFCYEK